MRGRFFTLTLALVFAILVIGNSVPSRADSPIAFYDHFNIWPNANWSWFGNGTISAAKSFLSIRNGINTDGSANVTGIVSSQSFAIGTFIFQGNFTGSVAFGLQSGIYNGILFKSNQTGVFVETNATSMPFPMTPQGREWIQVATSLASGMHIFKVGWGLSYVAYSIDSLLLHNETVYVPLVNLRLVAMAFHGVLMLDYVSVGSYLVQSTSTVTQTLTSTSLVVKNTTSTSLTVVYPSTTTATSSTVVTTETGFTETTTTIPFDTITIQGESTSSVITGVTTQTGILTETVETVTSVTLTTGYASTVTTISGTQTTFVAKSQTITSTSVIHVTSVIADTTVHTALTETASVVIGGLLSAPWWFLIGMTIMIVFLSLWLIAYKWGGRWERHGPLGRNEKQLAPRKSKSNGNGSAQTSDAKDSKRKAYNDILDGLAGKKPEGAGDGKSAT